MSCSLWLYKHCLPSLGGGRVAATVGLQTEPRKGQQVLEWFNGLGPSCPNSPAPLDESLSPIIKERDGKRKNGLFVRTVGNSHNRKQRKG